MSNLIISGASDDLVEIDGLISDKLVVHMGDIEARRITVTCEESS